MATPRSSGPGTGWSRGWPSSAPITSCSAPTCPSTRRRGPASSGTRSRPWSGCERVPRTRPRSTPATPSGCCVYADDALRLRLHRQCRVPVASELLMSRQPEGGGFFSVDSLRGVWVLLLDSDPAGLRSLTQVLEYCGALVTGVATPEQALQVMRQVRPDVLVAALTQEEQDAVGLIRRLRGFKPEDGGMIPAIVVVPSAQFGEERMRAWGSEGY